MPAHNKGLTSAFALRLDPSERTLADRVVAEYAEFDIKISINDAFRILIRRGAQPPYSLEDVRVAIQQHWVTCGRCDADTVAACPDGQWLKRAHDRLMPAATPPARAKGPARRTRVLPPPPGVNRKS